MKIAAINGSSKTTGISTLIVKQMEKHLDEQVEIYHAMRLVRAGAQEEAIVRILEADILLIVFPLYVDSLPFPLIELLTKLEKTEYRGTAIPQVFAIANGALDAAQIEPALEMIEHFSRHAGLPWGYGIGIGAGSVLYNVGDNWENGPASDIHNALCDMAIAIKNKTSSQNLYVMPKFPCFLYKSIANIGFLFEAKRNGVGNLRARPYMECRQIDGTDSETY